MSSFVKQLIQGIKEEEDEYKPLIPTEVQHMDIQQTEIAQKGTPKVESPPLEALLVDVPQVENRLNFQQPGVQREAAQRYAGIK